MPDYWITAVGKNHDGTIGQLEVRANQWGTPAVAEYWPRLDVVNAIRFRNKTFRTAYRDGAAWRQGEDVRVVVLNGSSYLRTDANNFAADNLGNLPLLASR